MNVKVILASTRKGRQGEKVSAWVMQELSQDKRVSVELLDLRDYILPYYNDALPASMLKAPYSPPIRQKWAKKNRRSRCLYYYYS